MSTSVFTVLLLNLAYIGMLPRLFFRQDGRFNLKWWLTAAPFVGCAVLATLHFSGVKAPEYGPDERWFFEGMAALLSVASVALISLTLGTHRRRLSLWHQLNDTPEEIVTYGAYRYIRHPFYTAFILALFATCALCLSLVSAAVCLYGLLILNYTAAREESSLQGSALGAQYVTYLRQSGRFLPRFGVRRTNRPDV